MTDNIEVDTYGAVHPVTVEGSVKVEHDVYTRPQSAEYGVWQSFALLGTEPAQQLLRRDEYRARALLVVQNIALSPVTLQAPIGSVNAPAAGQVITSVALPAGVYNIAWTIGLGGTTGNPEINNFQLVNGAAVVAGSINGGTTGALVNQAGTTIIVPAGGATVAVQAIALSTVGSTYRASITATPLVTTGSLWVGSRPQLTGTVLTGGRLQAGTYEIKNQQELYMIGDGVNPVTVAILTERWGAYRTNIPISESDSG